MIEKCIGSQAKDVLVTMTKFVCKLHGYIVYFFFLLANACGLVSRHTAGKHYFICYLNLLVFVHLTSFHRRFCIKTSAQFSPLPPLFGSCLSFLLNHKEGTGMSEPSTHLHWPENTYPHKPLFTETHKYLRRVPVTLTQQADRHTHIFPCVAKATWSINIVACQRGGVSNKPPWAPGSDKTRGQGSFGLFTGEPGTSQYGSLIHQWIEPKQGLWLLLVNYRYCNLKQWTHSILQKNCLEVPTCLASQQSQINKSQLHTKRRIGTSRL